MHTSVLHLISVDDEPVASDVEGDKTGASQKFGFERVAAVGLLCELE